MRVNSKQKQKGGTLAFAVVLILVIILIGIGFFALSLYFGGAQETKDAVNAGALNVAKKALTINSPLSSDPSQKFFSDVVDSNEVNLVTINRVWSKALFVAINAEAAKNDGGHDGTGGQSAAAAHDAAMAISDALAKQLNTPTNLYTYFDQYSQQNSVRMLGLGAQVQRNPTADWVNSYLERTYESNVEFANNIPSTFTNTSSIFTATKRKPQPGDAAGRQWLAGYTPLHVMDQDFWQVAFPFEQKPHIVDRSFFTQNDQTPLTVGTSNWSTPVANAFGVAGTTQKTSSGLNETAVSWAETNPQKVYPMVFPNAFVRIVIKKNTLQWLMDEAPMNSEDYGFISDSKDSVPVYAECGDVRGTAYVGNEYIPPTLYKAICAVPPINGHAMDYLLQRVQEMIPNYSMTNLVAHLNTCPILPDAEDQTFYLYPIANNTDVVVTPDAATFLPSGCDKGVSADGTEQTLDHEGPVPFPNFATQTFDCYGSYTWPTPCFLEGDRTWVPGTGWNGGCLGELRIHRTTTVHLFWILCQCPV
jgi:hypothetical protein